MWRVEQKGKWTHGRGQQRGDSGEEGSVRGLHGNGENTIKIKSKNKNKVK